MEKASLFSPTSPHFFQPLLSGFEIYLKIPVTFFSKHIKGKHEGKTVKLRSDSSDRTWKVKMESHTLTEGWKEFAKAHDLRVGDVVIFRHEGDVLFHVTAFGTSFCEIQYKPSVSHDVKEESDEIGESSRKKKESSSKLTCFSQTVTAANLSNGALGVPIDFARRNGLNKGRHKVVLMNQEGKTWESEVKCKRCGQVFIRRNWRRFCTGSKLKVGDSFKFKLHQNTEATVFQLCNLSKVKRKKKTDTSEEDFRFVKVTPSASSLEIGKQHLPVHFTRGNKLDRPGKIVLVDKDKGEWLMKLKEDIYSGSMYIMGGTVWRSFCEANEVVAGESLTLELIRRGRLPLLKFCSKMEQPPFKTKARGHTNKRARVQTLSQESRSKHDVSYQVPKVEQSA